MPELFPTVETGAEFSPCRRYRYVLTRTWGDGPRLAVIGLNPSTADETQDDPTIRRCIGFARDWAFGGLVMLNLFAFRSTDPRVLYKADDPIGPDNDEHLAKWNRLCVMTVAAWGVHGLLRGRGDAVRAMLTKLHHLGLTKDGCPKHPLYLPKSAQPVLWEKE